MTTGRTRRVDSARGLLLTSTENSAWERVGQVPGQPTALKLTDSEWYAASDQGFFSSMDTGFSWQHLFTYGGAS